MKNLRESGTGALRRYDRVTPTASVSSILSIHILSRVKVIGQSSPEFTEVQGAGQ